MCEPFGGHQTDGVEIVGFKGSQNDVAEVNGFATSCADLKPVSPRYTLPEHFAKVEPAVEKDGIGSIRQTRLIEILSQITRPGQGFHGRLMGAS